VKERTRLSSGNMLLLELLFAMIFFGLSLSVTLSVFGEAYVLSKQAEGKDMAVAEANDVAEIIRSARSASEIDDLFTVKGLTKNTDGKYTAGFGNNKYDMVISTALSGRLFSADIKCYDLRNEDGTPIYELTVEHVLKDGEAQSGTSMEDSDGR
jgi:hypothetical protein